MKHLSMFLLPWLASARAMAQTRWQQIEIGEMSFTYLEVGLAIALVLCIMLIVALWRSDGQNLKRARKAEQERDVTRERYFALQERHKTGSIPDAQASDINKDKAPQDGQEDILHDARPETPNDNPPAESEEPVTIELDITPQPQRKLYARQDAQNANRLIALSDTYDMYEHFFVITLDAGSDTEGEFEIIANNTAKFFSNSDNSKCCKFETNADADNYQQTAGRVRINGTAAEVVEPIIITNKHVAQGKC